MEKGRNENKKISKEEELIESLTDEELLYNVSFAPRENGYLKESGDNDEE